MPEAIPRLSRDLDFERFTRDELDKLEKLTIHVKEYRPGKLLKYILDHKSEFITIEGLWLEFGVWKGTTINWMAATTNQTVYGFDSFEGLPHDWDRGNCIQSAKDFNLNGKMPRVRDNVILIKGWFKDTIPQFAKIQKDKPIALMHVDCDLYSSTKQIFDNLANNIVAGTVIIFDELINYPRFQHEEWKAFYDFVQSNKIEIKWLPRFGGILRTFDNYINMSTERKRNNIDPEAAVMIC
jgi:hypothetical protein